MALRKREFLGPKARIPAHVHLAAKPEPPPSARGLRATQPAYGLQHPRPRTLGISVRPGGAKGLRGGQDEAEAKGPGREKGGPGSLSGERGKGRVPPRDVTVGWPGGRASDASEPPSHLRLGTHKELIGIN